MRLTIIIVVLTGVLVGGFLLSETWKSAEVPAPGEAASDAAGQRDPSGRVVAEPVASGPDATALAKLGEAAEAKQREIEALLRSYDANLRDPAERARIERQIDTLMAEYDAAVLPVATAEMKRRSSR